MNPGTIISGTAHAALILYALFGGMFSRDAMPPPDAAQVTLLSEEQFAALTRPDTAEEQQPATEAPSAALEIPEPATPAEPEPEPEPTPEPEPAAPVESEAVPEAEPAPPAPAQPAPPEIVEADPIPPAPPVSDDRPVAPQDVPRPAPRVSAEATPAPPPEAEEAPEIVEAPPPETVETPEQIVEDQTPTAPPESAKQIVTEADRPTQITNAAPPGSPRPRDRPTPPAQPVEEPTAPRTEPTTTTAASDNVNDATRETIAGLQERLEQAPQEGVAAGPPLTAGEREAFRLAVQRCWIVDTGSQAANVTVSIRFEMSPDAQVVTSSMRQTGASGGDDAAIAAAYEAGRRAILRCQNQDGGYNLPAEKYGQWQEVEVTFNPEGMRLR
ncbi:cell envelope biogenesis protein TolA [Palleronia sp. LCG004]|uniref:cell envelope biogenesis protein TolA n=1 Tax=Palleronia sp. LCG004 TaxID=3079304 RepID=UPI002943B1A9|nr:cell envelope biogenesis protein TolA [Palleronia sp. LCG004]WOI55844.1 cell envelope biogenesis protein TolA [Palleronia sp. LCG004]